MECISEALENQIPLAGADHMWESVFEQEQRLHAKNKELTMALEKLREGYKTEIYALIG
jgi:hypothetical protein